MVFDNSNVVFHGTLVSNNNGQSGIGIFRLSSASSYGDVTIRAHNNARHGIEIAGLANMFTNRGTINVEKNAGHGVLVWGATLFATKEAIFIVKHNKRAGLKVDDVSYVYLHKSILTDNGTDVALSFGARATLKGNTIGTITCDKNSMIRGDVACPESKGD